MSIIALLLLMPAVVIAQIYPGMNEEDMQKILEMQSCMEKVDQAEFKLLEQRQNRFDAEMKSLCGSGKRDEAQKKALLFEKEMMTNPTIQAIKKCSEIAKEMMPEMSFMSQDDKSSNEHVCDSY